MLKILKSVDGVDIYETNLASIQPGDLVIPGRVTAFGVYYLTDQYPRFRTAISDDLQIDESSAAVQVSDLISWSDTKTIVDSVVFIFAHNLSDEDLLEWEKEAVAIPFMKSQGCDFMADAVGEFAI